MRRGVLAGFAAYNRKDFDLVPLHYRPDAVVQVLDSAGLRQFWNLWMDAWADWRLVPVEVIDLPGKMLVLRRVEAQGASSGAQATDSAAIPLTFEGGAVSRHDEWRDWQEALEAVGPSE